MFQCSLLIIACFTLLVIAETDYLTRNFFDNLEADPRLIARREVTENSKKFIDKQIQNYVKLRTQSADGFVKQKRSLADALTKDFTGTYLLDGIEAIATIEASFPSDIALFYQNGNWYGAALERDTVQGDPNDLVIYKHNATNNSFLETTRVNISNGVRVASYNLQDSTLIVVAENASFKENFEEKSGIYIFDSFDLKKIQSLDMNYASDIFFWEIHNEIFMSIVDRTGVALYKWLGNHFDHLQAIKSDAARRVTPFKIGARHYLAVANFKDNSGRTKIYSEIYKFDYHSEKYGLHQRILTRACTDIKYFAISEDEYKRDHFLVVANSYREDFDYETESIIYKFLDDYFIPFQGLLINGIEEWVPVKGLNNEFVLFASTRFDGIKSYQYDGWAFTENAGNTPEILRGRDTQSIRSYDFNNSSVIVVANRNNRGNIANVFKLSFNHHNILNKIHNELFDWCDRNLEKVALLSKDAILGKAQRSDIKEDEQSEFDQISSKIDSLNLELDDLEVQAHDFLQNDVQKEVKKNMSADEMIFKNRVYIREVKAEKINGFDVNDLMENSVNTEDGFELDKLEFDSLEIENDFEPLFINDRPADSMVHCYDDFNLKEFEVRGNLIAEKGVEIDGPLNGIFVSDEKLLLIDRKQMIPESVTLREMQVDNVETPNLNGQPLDSLTPIKVNDFIHEISHVKSLKVKNLLVGGYINDVDIPTLDKYALKKHGNQVVSAEYIFDTLVGQNLESENPISGKRLEDLIPTDGGAYAINQDLIFKETLKVNNLRVLNFLSGITVTNNTLDVLLKNADYPQELTGDKIFNNVKILNPITLRGKIKNPQLEKRRPLLSLDHNIILEGDKTITGKVKADFIKARNVITPDGAYSLKRLQADGLRLTEKEIQPKLRFLQQINVDEIFVDRINGIDIDNFVVTGANDVQIIHGTKYFNRDLFVTGATTVGVINDINVAELENNVLKLDGDQIITGKHTIKRVIADNYNVKPKIKFGALSLDTLTPNGDNSKITIIEGDYASNDIKAKEVRIKGLVNGVKFDEMVEDTVTKNTSVIIGGRKTFENLTVSVLNSNGTLKLPDLDKFLNNVELSGSLKINKPMRVENVFFKNQFNGVAADQFGKSNVDESNTEIIEGDLDFDTINVLGKAYVTSNEINGVNIDRLVQDTVKLDEPFDFKTVTFESAVISEKPVLLKGQIENVDFDNIVFSNSETEQVIFGEKTFLNTVTVDSLNGTIKGVDLKNICDFSTTSLNEAKNLTIEGHAYFSKGPNVEKINSVPVQEIFDNAWFEDRETELTGYVEFDDVVFKNDIDVQAFVDNVSLKLLSENYFSKSKDQIITAHLQFQDGLIFENDLTVSEMEISGDINGVNIDEFVTTALIDNYDQVFETEIYLEKCKINELTGEFLVNDMDLNVEVMRYDKMNMVTGKKTFRNLYIDNLKLEKNIKIQGVDIWNWIKDSVLKNGTFNITGTKTFNNVVFEKGLILGGLLNNQHFSEANIMLKNVPQEITGRKTIITNPLDPATFKAIKLKGLLNNIDISQLINNQAYKSTDNTFKTPINFKNNISTNNLVINKSFQGMNLTDLIANVTNLNALNSLSENFVDLLKMSAKIKHSIRNQAYFLNHYKIIQEIPVVTNSMKILCPDGRTRIGTLFKNGSRNKIELYGYHPETELFLRDDSIHFNSEDLSFVDQVLMGRYFYVEGNDDTGKFMRMEPSMKYVLTISSNNTRSTVSFINPITNHVCTLFIYYNCNPRIFCEINENIEIMQDLDIPAAYEASAVTTSGVLYLATINPRINKDPLVTLWRLNNSTKKFEISQSMFETEPKSISLVSHNGFTFLAIASGHLPSALYSGRIAIKLFEEQKQMFVEWQDWNLEAPVRVEFAVLPSSELVLYVLTENPTQPMIVYRYEGIAGFKEAVVGSALPKISYFNQLISGNGQHFVMAQSYDRMTVIQAMFKGEKVADD